jgi:alkaline phosphatase
MEYEHDRPSDTGGEPSLSEMTAKSIELLDSASRKGRKGNSSGYFLMVESGRIDHAHHEGNAWRALTDAEELDRAVGEALSRVDLRDTLILVTADHSHVFTMAGYPLRPMEDLGYAVAAAPDAYLNAPHNNLFDVVYDVDDNGVVAPASDRNGAPYTILGYHNGPGYRGTARVNPFGDPFKGRGNTVVDGPNHPNYLQESAVPLGSETHAGEDVALYAIGAGAQLVRGTMPNTNVYNIMASALGLR